MYKYSYQFLIEFKYTLRRNSDSSKPQRLRSSAFNHSFSSLRQSCGASSMRSSMKSSKSKGAPPGNNGVSGLGRISVPAVLATVLPEFRFRGDSNEIVLALRLPFLAIGCSQTLGGLSALHSPRSGPSLCIFRLLLFCFRGRRGYGNEGFCDLGSRGLSLDIGPSRLGPPRKV